MRWQDCLCRVECDRVVALFASSGGGFLLALPHLRVQAPLCQQGGMVAAFSHLAAVEHQDLVGIDDGREAVGDDQCRAPD